MIYRFDITIHAAPAVAVRGEPVQLGGAVVTPLHVLPQPMQTPLPAKFEEAAERLTALPRLFFEPDGSFVWVSSNDEARWQVEGNLYDMGPRLMYASLKGSCSHEGFDELLSALGWPDVELVFQVTTPSLFLDETEFRRFAAASNDR